MIRKLIVATEGARDRAFLEALQRKGLLSDAIHPLPERKPKMGPDGKEIRLPDGIQGVGREIWNNVDARVRVVGMTDLDAVTADARAKEVLDEANKCPGGKDWPLDFGPVSISDRIARAKATGRNGDEEVAIVLVTLRDDPSLKRFAFTTTTLDDYVLRLLLDPTVFGAFAKSERLVISSHVDAVKKLDELRDLLAANNAPIEDAKRAVAALAAAIGFMSSPADLAERLIKNGDPSVVDKLLQPLLDDCRLAMT